MLKHAGYKAEIHPFYLDVPDSAHGLPEFRQALKDTAALLEEPLELVRKLPEEHLQRNKYDVYSPVELLQAAYVQDVLDVPGTQNWLAALSGE